MMNAKTSLPDVLVIGGGIAGMATAIQLARAGLRVSCLEADVEDEDPVGESLDWSAPELLKSIGLSMERLLDEGIADLEAPRGSEIAQRF